MTVSLSSGSTLFLTTSQSESALPRLNPLNASIGIISPVARATIFAFPSPSVSSMALLDRRTINPVNLLNPPVFPSESTGISGSSNLLLRLQSLRVQLPNRLQGGATLAAPILSSQVSDSTQRSDSAFSMSESVASSDRSISRFGSQSPCDPEYSDQLLGSPVSFSVELTALVEKVVTLK